MIGVSGEKSLDESAEESQSKEGSRGPCLRLAMQSMFLGNELGTSRPTSSQVLSIYLNRGLRLPVHLSVISLYREFMRQGDLGRSLSISFCTETH